MRFGTFVFSISHDPKEDHQVIENTLREVELAEGIGLDAVWLTEHHFDGADVLRIDRSSPSLDRSPGSNAWEGLLGGPLAGEV